MWVRKQYTYVLFTENWSNVAATVHVPYMNSSRKWKKKREKKKKKKGKNAANLNAGNANPNTHLMLDCLIHFLKNLNFWHIAIMKGLKIWNYG